MGPRQDWRGAALVDRLGTDDVTAFGDGEEQGGHAGRAQHLMADYPGPREQPLSFIDVERIWREEVRPLLPEFTAMEEGEPPPEGSRWRHNFHIADPGQV